MRGICAKRGFRAVTRLPSTALARHVAKTNVLTGIKRKLALGRVIEIRKIFIINTTGCVMKIQRVEKGEFLPATTAGFIVSY